jgi:signal peptidase
MYRLPVDVPVAVDGIEGRMMEASPVGCAVMGPFADLEPGAQVRIVVSRPGAAELVMDATVANRRAAHPARTVLGLSLRPDPAQRITWVGALFDAAARHPAAQSSRSLRRPTNAAPDRPRLRTLVFRFQMVLVGVVSIVAASILALVLLGLRPLVISSGSMRPTLEIGDVVVTSWVRADRVHDGNIVSFDDPGQHGLFITHRVRNIAPAGSSLRFETRGDANSISEIWTVPRQTLLKRTEWKVPLVGGVAGRIGSGPVRAGLFGASAALAGTFLGLAALRSRRNRLQRASMKSTDPLGDAEPKNRAVPNAAIEPSRPSR